MGLVYCATNNTTMASNHQKGAWMKAGGRRLRCGFRLARGVGPVNADDPAGAKEGLNYSFV